MHCHSLISVYPIIFSNIALISSYSLMHLLQQLNHLYINDITKLVYFALGFLGENKETNVHFERMKLPR